MMTLTYIIAAIILLGLCIFVHELGHLLGGKMVGIKAKVFSMGYGKGVFKKKVGDTTYQVTLIPFGGYCQFYGEDPSEERTGQGFEFLSAHPLKRIVTVAMGPIFNLLFGIFLFFVMNLWGYTQETNRVYVPDEFMTGSHVSPAAAAGLKTGDKILEIDGTRIEGFTDIQAAVMFSEGRELKVKVQREGTARVMTITPRTGDGGRYSIGVMPFGTKILIAGVMEGDVAERAGLQEMDEVIAIDGVAIKTPLAFTDYIKERTGKKLTLSLVRAGREITVSLIPRMNTMVSLEDSSAGAAEPGVTALFDTGMLRDSFDKKKLALNGKTFNSFDECMKALAASKGRDAVIEKDGETFRGRVAIETRGFIGVYPALSPEMVLVKYGVAEGFTQALVEPYKFIVMNLKGMGMLFSGKMDVRENVSGPIRIAKIAGDVAYYKGLSAFIILMAKISIILMVMNFLPIPAVDGSHLIFYTVEMIRGKPLKQSVMEKIQTAGVIILIILGAFVIVNDISMLPFIQKLIN
jgi:regulator of sigma E protease